MLNGKKLCINNDGILLGDVKNKGRYGFGFMVVNWIVIDGGLDGLLDKVDWYIGLVVILFMMEFWRLVFKFVDMVMKSDGLGEDFFKFLWI